MLCVGGRGAVSSHVNHGNDPPRHYRGRVEGHRSVSIKHHPALPADTGRAHSVADFYSRMWHLSHFLFMPAIHWRQVAATCRLKQHVATRDINVASRFMLNLLATSCCDMSQKIETFQFSATNRSYKLPRFVASRVFDVACSNMLLQAT